MSISQSKRGIYYGIYYEERQKRWDGLARVRGGGRETTETGKEGTEGPMQEDGGAGGSIRWYWWKQWGSRGKRRGVLNKDDGFSLFFFLFYVISVIICLTFILSSRLCYSINSLMSYLRQIKKENKLREKNREKKTRQVEKWKKLIYSHLFLFSLLSSILPYPYSMQKFLSSSIHSSYPSISLSIFFIIFPSLHSYTHISTHSSSTYQYQPTKNSILQPHTFFYTPSFSTRSSF